MAQVAVVGDCYVDVICEGVSRLPEWGKDCAATGIRQMAGGSAGNTSIHLAALGRVAKFVYCAGADAQGDFYQQALVLAGVKPLRVASRRPTGVCVVLTGTAQDRAFVSSHGGTTD
eukprot:g46621.t1